MVGHGWMVLMSKSLKTKDNFDVDRRLFVHIIERRRIKLWIQATNHILKTS